MSKFKVIQTEYTNAKSLKKALDDLGIKYTESFDLKNPNLKMRGFRGDVRAERASILISKGWVDSNWSRGSSNDLGFAWDKNTKTFRAIISEYDQGVSGVTHGMTQLKQSYAKHEVIRSAKIKGYHVREQAMSDGTIRLALSGKAY